MSEDLARRPRACTFAPGNLLVAGGHVRTVGAALRRARAFRAWAGESVAFASDDPLDEIEAVLAALTVGFRLAVVPPEWIRGECRALVAPHVDRLVIRTAGVTDEEPGERDGPRSEPGLLVFTSGSTGQPAPVFHPLARLDTFGVGPRRTAHRWLLAYRRGSYAWTQVVMRGLLTPGHGLVAPASLRPEDLLAALVDGQATAVSATPTLWRHLLATTPEAELRQLPLTQIALGGERTDQSLLDRLRALFPEAKLTHVYATTECGPVLVASDGRAGFALHTGRRGQVDVRVEGGTLWVRSPFSADGPVRWVDTRDTAEVRDDRLHVLGRADRDVVNVGGSKVSLLAVEDVVLSLDGLLWARAYELAAPIVGSLVGIDVVLDPASGATAAEIERTSRRACRARLGAHAEPRRVRVLDAVPLASSLKSPVSSQGTQ